MLEEIGIHLPVELKLRLKFWFCLVLFALAGASVLKWVFPVTPVSAAEIMARPAQSVSIEVYDMATATQGLFFYWAGFPFGNCPLAVMSDILGLGGFYETFAGCNNGQGAVALHLTGYSQSGTGLYLPYYMRQGPVYIREIHVFTNCGGSTAPCHLRLIHDDGSYIDSSIQTTNELVIMVNHYESDLRLIVMTDIGNVYKDPTVSSITVIYDLSAPTNTPAPSATPAPTRTLPPTWTPQPTTGPGTPTAGVTIYPSATATIANTRIVAPPTAIPSLDQCSNLSNPCGPLAQFAPILFPTLNLPSPTPYRAQPTPTPRSISATPSVTFTPTPQIGASVTPAGTPISALLTPTSGFVDPLNALSDSIGAYQATSAAIMGSGINVSGTPQGIVGLAASLGGGVAQPIRIARMLEMTDLNKVGGFISFLLILIGGELLLSMVSVFMPILSKLITWGIMFAQLIAQIAGGLLSVVKGFIK